MTNTPTGETTAIEDDAFTFVDPHTGRRRWISPPDDPEPPRAGPDGFLNPAHAAWQGRREWARAKNIPPGAEPPPPTLREERLAIYDQLIEEAQEAVSAAARRRIAARAELMEAERPSRGVMDSGGRVLVGKPPQGRIARLRREIEELDANLPELKRTEERIRGDRLAIAAGRLPREVARKLEELAPGVDDDDDDDDDDGQLVELGSPQVIDAAFVPAGAFADPRGGRRISFSPDRRIEGTRDGEPARWVR
jgi:hypothetical protein